MIILNLKRHYKWLNIIIILYWSFVVICGNILDKTTPTHNRHHFLNNSSTNKTYNNYFVCNKKIFNKNETRWLQNISKTSLIPRNRTKRRFINIPSRTTLDVSTIISLRTARNVSIVSRTILDISILLS